mgnify:CR=1 FL=1
MNTITEQKLYELCTQLQSISGTKDKEAFIKKHKDNTDFLLYLQYLLDKLKVYGIQKRKLDKAIKNASPLKNLRINILNMYEYLLENNTGKDDDAYYVASYILKLPEYMQEWASASITKTLKLGVTAKSVNKALGYELITEFTIQRGKTFEDEKHRLKDEMLLASEKFNGLRGICKVVNGKPIFKTRQNQIIEGLLDLEKNMLGAEDGVYEGEIIVKERHKYKLRQVLQETIKIVNSDMPDKKVDWMLFDHLTHEEFSNPSSSRTYFERKRNMIAMGLETENVHIAPTLYVGKNHDVLYKMLDEIVSRGGEGLMINRDKPYQKDKTNHILKMKKKYTSDLRIVGFEEGKSTGKYKGTLGAFLLEYKGNIVKCGVMPDDIRNDVWNNQDKYLGKIVEIEHEQESCNQNNDLLSLEYPVFVVFRDKDEVSYTH